MRRIDPESSEGKAKMRAMDRMLEMLDYTNTKPRDRKKEPTNPPEDGGDPDEEAIELQEQDDQDDDASVREPSDDLDDGPVMSTAEAERQEEHEEHQRKPHKTIDLRKLRHRVEE